jgi:hypothetical protein
MNRIQVFMNHRIMLTLCCAFILIISAYLNPSFAGEIYRWVDENGEVHYSDADSGQVPSKDQKTEKIYIEDTPAIEKETGNVSRKPGKREALKASLSKEVIIYTLDT